MLQNMSAEKITLSIVVPFCNEERNVEAFFSRILHVLNQIGEPFEIICVNDGSVDGTLEQLLAWQRRTPQIAILDLSRNFGKEAALTAIIYVQ